MNTQILTEFHSIVLIGGFNPMIFHPFWMLQKGLIAEKDVTKDKILVHDQLSRFAIGDWLEFTVNKKRCEFKAMSKDNVVLMLDLIKGMLNALPEIPIMAIGINRGRVIKLDNEDDYYKVGVKLAPLNIWNDSFKNPRLRTIAIEDTKSEDFDGTSRCIIIKPAEIDNVQYAIDVNMNNHYDLETQNVVSALSVIEEHANEHFDYFETVLKNLFDYIQK